MHGSLFSACAVLKRFARQRALAGRHLPDMPAVERNAAGCDEAAPVCGLVVDGPQVAHVEHDAVCPQCKGSGRVIVSCEVTTYISAYVPENNQK